MVVSLILSEHFHLTFFEEKSNAEPLVVQILIFLRGSHGSQMDVLALKSFDVRSRSNRGCQTRVKKLFGHAEPFECP